MRRVHKQVQSQHDSIALPTPRMLIGKKQHMNFGNDNSQTHEIQEQRPATNGFCSIITYKPVESVLQIFLEPKAPQANAVILHMLKCELLCKSNATVLPNRWSASGVTCLHPALTHSFTV